MGVNLTILPLFNTNKSTDFSHDVLRCHCEEMFFDLIKKTSDEYGVTLDDPLYCFLSRDDNKEEHYGSLYIDAYGAPLKSITAKIFKVVMVDYKSTSWKNNAVIAYINQLPDGLKLYLYWH